MLKLNSYLLNQFHVFFRLNSYCFMILLWDMWVFTVTDACYLLVLQVHVGLYCYRWLLPACVTGKQLVTFSEWDKIDLEEMKRGAEVGKPREKITQISEMLKVASSWKKTMTKWFFFSKFRNLCLFHLSEMSAYLVKCYKFYFVCKVSKWTTKVPNKYYRTEIV